MSRSIRVILAGIVGGVVMFVWGAVAHMVLPIGEMGVRSLPTDPALTTAMTTNIKERGFYFFPPYDPKDKSDAAMKAFEEKVKQGPNGVLIINPGPGEGMSPKKLGVEFGSNLAAAMLAACVLSRYCGGRVCRTVAATMFGGIVWLSVNVSYWNWYEFPWDFTLGQALDSVLGWAVSGFAIALVLPKGCCGSGGCKCGNGGCGTGAKGAVVV